MTWTTVPLLLREVMQLLLNSDAHEIQQRTVDTSATKGEESRRFLLDLPEGVICRDADRKIDCSAVAGAKESATRIRPGERRLQKTLLCRQGEHRVCHATTLDPCGTHFRYHIAQPARMDSTTRSEIKNEFNQSSHNKTTKAKSHDNINS